MVQEGGAASPNTSTSARTHCLEKSGVVVSSESRQEEDKL